MFRRHVFVLLTLFALCLLAGGCGGGGVSGSGSGGSAAPDGGSSEPPGGGSRSDDDGRDDDGRDDDGQASGQLLRFAQQGSWIEAVVRNDGDTRLHLELRAPSGNSLGEAPPGVDSILFLDIPSGNQPLQWVDLQLDLRAAGGPPLDHQELQVIEPIDLGQEPRLALSASALADLRRRYAEEVRTQYILGQQVLAPADQFLAAPIPIPDQGGAWAGSGDADGIARSLIHAQLAETCLKLGLAWVLTADPRYAQGVADLLSGYADRYPGYVLHDRNGAEEGQRLLPDAARLMAQTLDEARLMVDFTRGLDLIRGSGVLNADENERIGNAFLRPSAQLLRGHQKGIHNIQCWINSAAFLAFALADDWVAAHDCLYGKLGLEEVLSEGVCSDGSWLEGSFMYHFFAAEAILPVARAIRSCQLACDITPLERMFQVPYDIASSDGRLPMLNDGTLVGLGSEGISQVPLYEQASRLYLDDQVNRPLRRWTRGSDYLSLVFGGIAPGGDPPADPPPQVLLPDLGLAVLRNGPAAFESSLAVDFGPHGGDHGHADKLGLNAWLGGRPAIGEASTNLYGEKLYKDYYKRSLAHSTAVIEGREQQPSSGSLVRLDREDQILETRTVEAYPGATLTRLSHMTPEGHLLDLMLVENPQAAEVDYVLHCFATTVDTAAPFVAASDAGHLDNPAYRALSQVRVLDTADDIDLRFTDGFGSHTIRVAGLPGTRLILAEAPWTPFGSTAPVLIVRRQGSRAVFGVAAVDGDQIPNDLQLRWDLPHGKMRYLSPGRPEALELEFTP